jgi:MtaA/CmuA family methyltransferase
MTKEQFALLRSAAAGKIEKPFTALIVDSPWIPGYAGISAMEYFLEPDKWLRANIDIVERFPDVVMLSGFWVEYGMAVEPSAFGCKVSWWKDHPPSVNPMMRDISEVRDLSIPMPENDGLMPLVLHLQRWAQKQIEPLGYSTRVVSARGPLALATHLRGVTEFLTDIMIEPDDSKRLLDLCTETVIRWLRAQAENVPDCEGILVLDDIPGLLSPAMYEEFAHPYLKRIFDAFPGMLKIYHNDANVEPFAERLAESGFDILNFSHNFDTSEAFRRIGDKVTLLGNVPPLNVLARGTVAEVRECADYCLNATQGRIILSAGGGTSSGTPAENIDALVDAVRSWRSN